MHGLQVQNEFDGTRITRVSVRYKPPRAGLLFLSVFEELPERLQGPSARRESLGRRQETRT